MLCLIMGSAAFLLYFLYDLNSILWKRRVLTACFAAGTLFLALASAGLVLRAAGRVGFGNLSPLWLVLSFASFLLLMDALFFALPADRAYQGLAEGDGVTVTTGMYALCRHPGVLWLMLVYLFLFLAFPERDLILGGILFSFLDLCYVILQDRWTFPRQFADYNAYQKTTPFLLPDRQSIKRALQTRRHFR